jgi:type II secretory pathway pseudopilin PulG
MELLVIIAIIAVLIGLLLPAVQKVRQAALRVESANNFRQIAIATNNFAAEYGNRLPSIDGNAASPNIGKSLFVALLPYVEQGDQQVPPGKSPGSAPFLVKTYISPADPTVTDDTYPASYAANAQVFHGSPALPRSFADGTSSTIAFAEHLAIGCGGGRFVYVMRDPGPAHRATFADGGPLVDLNANCGDNYPQTTGPPPTSTGARPGTFQVMPWPVQTKCDPHLANSPHSAGMLVAMGDGSVRMLARGMSPTTYWAAVTPDGGETLGNDW